MKKLLLLFFLCSVIKSTAAEGMSQYDMDSRFAKKLEDSISCEDSSSKFYSCFLHYNGTEIEIVNPRAYTRPNVYVHKLNPSHYIMARGKNCIELFIRDPSLQAKGNTIIPASVLIHGSGRIWPEQDETLRLKCENF